MKKGESGGSLDSNDFRIAPPVVVVHEFFDYTILGDGFRGESIASQSLCFHLPGRKPPQKNEVSVRAVSDTSKPLNPWQYISKYGPN